MSGPARFRITSVLERVECVCQCAGELLYVPCWPEPVGPLPEQGKANSLWPLAKGVPTRVPDPIRFVTPQMRWRSAVPLAGVMQVI